MNRYLMSIRHFFSGEETFEVQAENRGQAMVIAEKRVYQDPKYSVGGNYDRLSLKIVKKLQHKKKKGNE